MTAATTTTVPVLELVGQPVAGRRAMVNRRYDWEDWRPMWRTLKEVRRYVDRGVEWVQWTWEPDPTAGRYDCGYSGVTVDLAARERRSLVFDGTEAAQ